MNKINEPTAGSITGCRNFSKWLVTIRTAHKESQEALADAVGVDRKTITHYEIGQRWPRIDIVMKIAEHYGLDEISFRITDEAPEPSTKVAYICDGMREDCKKVGCGYNQQGEFRECYRTFDIQHAKNFRRVGFYTWEEVADKSDMSTNNTKPDTKSNN